MAVAGDDGAGGPGRLSWAGGPGGHPGGVELDPTRWSTVWFKGGSEPGVLTLGYRAVAANGTSYVVVAMVENPESALAPSATLQLVDVVKGAFGLLRW